MSDNNTHCGAIATWSRSSSSCRGPWSRAGSIISRSTATSGQAHGAKTTPECSCYTRWPSGQSRCWSWSLSRADSLTT